MLGGVPPLRQLTNNALTRPRDPRTFQAGFSSASLDPPFSSTPISAHSCDFVSFAGKLRRRFRASAGALPSSSTSSSLFRLLSASHKFFR
jgi:hypothetical protein